MSPKIKPRNESIIVDFLLSDSKGDTFCFDSRSCPLNILQEIILRGYQVQERSSLFKPIEPDTFFSGEGKESRGSVYGYGSGHSVGYGLYDRLGWGWGMSQNTVTLNSFSTLKNVYYIL